MEATSSKKYSAPALEKGLDILELLSKDATPLSTSTIAEKLGRSNAEIYRMILVLEQRGYIEKSEDIDGYQVTRRLLQLGTEHEPIKDQYVLSYRGGITRANRCYFTCGNTKQLVLFGKSGLSTSYCFCCIGADLVCESVR